jgi:hypothetical protein
MASLLAQMISGAVLALATSVHHALGLGPTRRQLQRWCDARNLPYTDDNFSKARADITAGGM